MPASIAGRRRSAASLRNACSSGKPRVTIAPSTATGRQATISGLVGGCALSWATIAGQAARSWSSSGSRRPGSAARRRGLRAAAVGRGGRRRARRAAARRRCGAGRGGAAGARRSARGGRRRGAGSAAVGVGVAAGLGAASGAVAGGSRRRRLGAWQRRRWRRRRRAARRRGVGSWPVAARRAEPASVGTAAGRRRSGANIASSSWKRRPPMPARFGSIAASRRPAAASAAGSWRTAAGSARPADQLGPDRVDRLVEQRPDVAAALVERRRGGRRPAAPSPRTRGSTNASTTSASARPSRSRTVASSMRSGAADSSWSSIDSASRMPPAASRAIRWTAAGVGDPAVGLEDPVELALDLGDRQAADVVALEARQDRRREA